MIGFYHADGSHGELSKADVLIHIRQYKGELEDLRDSIGEIETSQRLKDQIIRELAKKKIQFESLIDDKFSTLPLFFENFIQILNVVRGFCLINEMNLKLFFRDKVKYTILLNYMIDKMISKIEQYQEEVLAYDY